MVAKRAMQERSPLPPSFAARDFGYPQEDRPFGFGSMDERRERGMLAPGLRSHPVGAHNTLGDLSFPFERPVSSSASIVTPQGPLVVVGGLSSTRSSSLRDSMTDPDYPVRTRPPSVFEGFVANATRPSITPSESISRVGQAGTGGGGRPSSPIARYVQEITYPALIASENIARLLGFARKSTTINTSSNPTSVAELPASPYRQTQSTTPSNFSWPMPPGVLKGWMGSIRRKSKPIDDEQGESRWSSTQQSEQFSRSDSPTGSENSRDGLITALPEIITALPGMREKRDARGSWTKSWEG